MTLVDAGPLVAILDRNDVGHRRCVGALSELVGPMLTTWPAFTEAMHLIGARGGWRSQDKLWRLVLRNDLHIEAIDAPGLKRASELMQRYRDLPMDLADATLVVLAEARKVSRIFTLDKDFRVYRLHGRRAFEIVP